MRKIEILKRIKNIAAGFKNVTEKESIKLITETGEGFYSWNGKLYKSDLIRACIRPKVKAVGKLQAKHVRNDGKKIDINPEPYMKFLLSDPNPFMSGQMLQEKIATQLMLNNNAFILIVRDCNNMPCALYPINASSVRAKYEGQDKELYLDFMLVNGKTLYVPYTEIIHLRDDFYNSDIFGESNIETLKDVMTVVTTLDQGIVKAIKNSSVIRWLLKYSTPLKRDDLKKNVKEFVDTYLSTESDTFGAAGVDSKVDAKQIEPKDVMPNALQQDRIIKRVYSYFNTNEKIVQSSYNENEWNSYYESQIEPLALQLQNEFTRKLFTRKERSYGNTIYFEAANLACASITTKLALVSMVDRGSLLPNEWRAVFNLAPVDGGDEPLRRLDTTTVNQANNK